MPIKVINSPKISESYQEDYKVKVLEDAKNSEILHALISGPKETITLDVDGIPIEIIEPSPRQLIPLQKATNQILRIKFATQRKKSKLKGDDSEEISEKLLSEVVEGFSTIEEFYEITDRLLADLTVEPTLTYEAFSSGLIPESKKAKILAGIYNWKKEKDGEKEETFNFREERDGSGASGSPA